MLTGIGAAETDTAKATTTVEKAEEKFIIGIVVAKMMMMMRLWRGRALIYFEGAR